MGFGKKKILCVFSNLLGLKIIGMRCREVLDGLTDIDVQYFFLGSSDYQEYPAPKWARISNTLESVFVARKKFSHEIQSDDFDLIIFLGFECALAFSKLARKIPAVLITDTTPKLAQELIRRADTKVFVRSRSFILGSMTSMWCGRTFSLLKYFVPVSDWCARSLVNNYHVARQNIGVIYPPIDLEKWRVRPAPGSNKIRLLFVGNDFERKGGPFLLDIFQKYLKDSCALTVVSNDPIMDRIAIPKGVDVESGVPHEEIPCIFEKADLFVFPTFRDQLGLVVQEAMASGLPVIARDVGGIGDLVQDGENGYLMPYHSGEQDWTGKIRYLIEHPQERERMGQISRKIAEEKFGQKKFAETLQNVLSGILE